MSVTMDDGGDEVVVVVDVTREEEADGAMLADGDDDCGRAVA